MSEELPTVPAFNEANIEKCLLEAQGDLFITSQMLGHVTVAKLLNSIRAVPRLQATFLTIQKVKALPEFDRISQEQLEVEVQRRMTLYRADALDSLHELAMMPIDPNSAMMQVKLSAAARLAAGVNERESSSELETTLRELNDDFHKNARTVKVMRETIEITSGGQSAARVIDSTASPAAE